MDRKHPRGDLAGGGGPSSSGDSCATCSGTDDERAAASLREMYELLPWLRQTPSPPEARSTRARPKGSTRAAHESAAGTVRSAFTAAEGALLADGAGLDILVYRGFRMSWDLVPHRIGRLDAYVLNGLGYGDSRTGTTVRLAPGCTGDDGEVALRCSAVHLSSGMAYFEPRDELEVETTWRLDSGDESPGNQRFVVEQIDGPPNARLVFELSYDDLVRRDARGLGGDLGVLDLTEYPERGVFLQGFQFLVNEELAGGQKGKCLIQGLSARIVSQQFRDNVRVLRVVVQAGIEPGVVHWLDAGQAVDSQVLRIFGRVRIGILGSHRGRFRPIIVPGPTLSAGLGGSAQAQVPDMAGDPPGVRVWFSRGFQAEFNPIALSPAEAAEAPPPLGAPTGLMPFLAAALAQQASSWPGRLVRELEVSVCSAEGRTNVVTTTVSNEGGLYNIEPQVTAEVLVYEGPVGSMTAEGVRFIAGWAFPERTPPLGAPPCEPLVGTGRGSLDRLREALDSSSRIEESVPASGLEPSSELKYQPDGGCADDG